MGGFSIGCSIYAGYPLHRENRENGQKEFPARENTGNLEILSKHREFGNTLIIKVENISKFAEKISFKKSKLDKSGKSVLCM